ncbi:hypothetical protein [Virgibacillus salexigens]|uniref:Uncharacterized protein n=1 Tax=Virgibacillus kapii TaxID=1638645 RepID=A0ABQ2DZN2_9BACI|nr:hypothetical protein [Virgibacillus kapii]GGJ77668.1 hypothetical protein GCM10007111_44080 [Virgibacillus kapii]
MLKRTKKNNTNHNVSMHSGIFKIDLPFFTFHKVPNENGILESNTVPVEIIIGNEFDLQRGKIATIIFYEDNNGLSVQNHFERLASIIANGYLSEFLNPIPFDEIEWVEAYTDPAYIFNVTRWEDLEWNDKANSFFKSDMQQTVWTKDNLYTHTVPTPWYVEYLMENKEKYQDKKYFFPDR